MKIRTRAALASIVGCIRLDRGVTLEYSLRSGDADAEAAAPMKQQMMQQITCPNIALVRSYRKRVSVSNFLAMKFTTHHDRY